MKRFQLISILILFISFMGVQSVVADEINGKPSEDGTYAATAYINGEYKVHSGLGDNLPYKPNPLTIKFDYPTNKVTYKAWLSDDVDKSHKITLTAGTQKQETELNNDSDTDGLFGKDKNDDYTEHKSLDITDKTIRSIVFTATQDGNKKIFVGDIYIHMAPHIILASNISKDYTFTNAVMGSSYDYAIDFQSFLSTANGNITVSSSNPTDFKIRYNGELHSDVVTIAGSNDFCSTSDSKGNFDIVFTPSIADKETKATITIKDTGSNEQITITVKGTASKKTPTITWREDKVLVYGTNYAENEIATSNCGTALTFVSSDDSVISVEDGKLIVNGDEGQTATITITTAGNGTWESITESKIFTVTRKQLQTITWEQNFLLLNTESQPIELNASVNSGKQITYSIADESIATIVDGKLTVKGVVGSTTITAYVAGDDTYYEASMTKQIFVRQKTDNCNDIYAVYDITTYSKSGAFNWDAIELPYTLATVGEYLSFEASRATGASGQSIKITDQNGSTIYESDKFESASGIKIERNVTKINISAATNLSRSIKNIKVTPAIYLESKQNNIDFGTIPVNSGTEKTVTIDWANQPDMIWATTDDEHFTVVNNAIFGGTCGDFGSTEIKIKFDPSEGRNYTGNLLIGVGENTTPVLTIPLSAVATKITHTLKWNEGIDNEVELNSIFNCNGKAMIVDNDNLHTIKYRYDSEYFDGLEDYPGILFAKKEGTTTIVAYIEETETCSLVEVPFEVTILPEKATMTWTQDLSNYIENTTTQTVTLNATSNKEGNVIYEIISNENNIISLSGNTMTIAADKVGNAQIKAYNENYPDVFIIKNVIVASVAPCHTEIDHGINLETDNSIIGQDKEAICTLTLDKKCKSVIFSTDLTGDGMNGESYGIVVVSDNVRGEILNKTFWDNGLTNETCDIDPEATQVTIKVTAISVTGSMTPVTAILKDVKTVLVSDFNNYTTDKERFDFGEFSVGASSVSDNLIISHWSLPGSINLSIESGNGKATPFSVEPAILNDNCGIGEKTVTVKLNPTIGGEFTDYLVIKTGGEEVVRRIPLTATIHKQNQTINWTVENLTTADRQVQLAKSDKNTSVYYEIVSGGDYAIVENNNLGLSSVSVIKAGTFKVRAYNDDSDIYNPYSTEEKEFTSTIGTIQFDNNSGDNNWKNSTNWLPINTINTQRNVEPSAVVNAVMTAEAVISNAERNKINNLTFETNGKLTIGATSGLKANVVNGATADNLTLKASDEGNATFIYSSGTPSATVEMYSKAIQNPKPEWQYMGVAVNGATTSDFPGAWLLKWTESENTSGDPWSDEPLAAKTALAPWAGYSISQPQATTYTTKGTLLHGNKEYSLSYTPSDDPDCGFNLLANSYTAPIDITKLTKKDFVNADACIVLYNTGTYADWHWHSQQGNSGEQPGQLTVIPVETVGATDLPKTIPSMQAFFVMAKEGGGTFTVDYETAVLGATNRGNQMRAPEARDEFNVLKIMIEGENTRDRLFLLENKNTSKEYDNGYEARKIFDAPRGHQMYATCQYGYASIDCSESFISQTIGLKGDSEGEQLTISFDTDRLEYYNSLYLYDKATGKYVNIMAGEKYTFFGIKGADDNRFSIVTNPNDENQTPPFVVIGEELAFDKSQIDTDNANIYIYDTSGRLLITDKINPYENYNIPNMPKGIYLVSMNGYTTKIVKK